MFGIFKKKKTKSYLAIQIESKGLDKVTTEVVDGLMRQLSGTGYMYHFILAELDGASMGNEKARKFARESGIQESEYNGHHKFEHPLIDGPNGAKTIMDMACLRMIDQQDLVVDFRLMTLDKLMRQVEVGKYDNEIDIVDGDFDGDFDGDKFWEWVKINCHRFDFKPKELQGWGDIKELDLNANNLSDLSDDLLSHTGLVDLSLFDNNFSSLPQPIFFMTKLTHLNLGINKITILPKDICKLKNLKILDLGYNKIANLPSEIGELAKLEQLIVHNNFLISIPKEIGSMTALKHISFYGNELSSLPDEILNLKSLRTLELQGNYFTKEAVKKWTDRFSDTQCKISFGYQKNQIAETVRVVENVQGGLPEDSFLGLYLNSVDGEAVSKIFQRHTSEPDEDDFLGQMLARKKYSKFSICEGLNAIDSLGNITPINIDLIVKSPSSEGELIEWAKIIYIKTCEKYGLRPNPKLKIVSVSTSGDTKGIKFMEL